MGKKFVISFAGDTSLGDWYLNQAGKKTIYQRLVNNPYTFFNGVKPLVVNSDYLILNLETVLAESPPIYFPDKKYPNWDCPERTINALKKLGVTAVSLANNHAMDFGPDVMIETKRHLTDAEIQVFGAGANLDEASKPYRINLEGEYSQQNVYILSGMRASKRYREDYRFMANHEEPGISPLNKKKMKKVIEGIQSQDPQALIVLFPHWQGIDYQWASESEKIRASCNEYIDAGVHYIVGHGPHMINHFEKRGNKTIAYSIGNFVFNSSGRYKKMQAPPYSAIAQLQIDEVDGQWQTACHFYPIVTDNRSTDYHVRPINEHEVHELTGILSKERTPKQELVEKNNEGQIALHKDTLGFFYTIT